jgi:hypothetical protein
MKKNIGIIGNNCFLSTFIQGLTSIHYIHDTKRLKKKADFQLTLSLMTV